MTTVTESVRITDASTLTAVYPVLPGIEQTYLLDMLRKAVHELGDSVRVDIWVQLLQTHARQRLYWVSTYERRLALPDEKSKDWPLALPILNGILKYLKAINEGNYYDQSR
jgi:hypothetical protein